MFNRQQIDHLLEEKKGELKKKFGSGFTSFLYFYSSFHMYVFYRIQIFSHCIIRTHYYCHVNQPSFFRKKRGVSFHCRPLFAFIGTGNILLASSINSPDIKNKSGFSPRRKGEFTFNIAAKISKIRRLDLKESSSPENRMNCIKIGQNIKVRPILSTI